MHPADHLRQAVTGYPLELLSDAIASVLHTDLVGARLVGLWLLEEQADIEAPPLTDAQVDAILARLRKNLL